MVVSSQTLGGNSCDDSKIGSVALLFQTGYLKGKN
jgi:hypothetical protein